MEKFKIGYFADGPWSYTAFNRIINDNTLKIEFIVPRSDSKDTTLLNYSEKHNIPYYKGIKVNSASFLSKAKEHDCDLFVSMSFNQIFKEKIINLPKYKTINCHAGKLPFYRGRNILNWVLINDEKEFGITVHYVDQGIDTGDILLQRTYPINEEDNYRTLLETAYEECSNILYDTIKYIQKGEIRPIKQETIHPIGFYCGIRSIGDEIINWNQSSRDIYNFVRAICFPGPKATTYKNNNVIKINRAKIINDAPIYKNTIGQIVGKTEDGFLVKTKDTIIEILEIDTDIKLRIGDKLG